MNYSKILKHSFVKEKSGINVLGSHLWNIITPSKLNPFPLMMRYDVRIAGSYSGKGKDVDLEGEIWGERLF